MQFSLSCQVEEDCEARRSLDANFFLYTNYNSIYTISPLVSKNYYYKGPRSHPENSVILCAKLNPFQRPAKWASNAQSCLSTRSKSKKRTELNSQESTLPPPYSASLALRDPELLMRHQSAINGPTHNAAPFSLRSSSTSLANLPPLPQKNAYNTLVVAIIYGCFQKITGSNYLAERRVVRYAQCYMLATKRNGKMRER